MDGLMMDYQLNVPAILRRADELYGDREIVSRLPDKSWHRYGYADFASRTKRLAVALRGLGLEDGDRVATLMWNHHEHLETYIGAPVGGFVTHTLNLRLHPDDNTYIATPRRGPGARRRQGALAARGAVRRPRRLRARDRRRRGRDARGRDRLRGARSPRRTRARSPIATSTSARRPRCASRAGRPACPRASSTRTARSRSTRSRPLGLLALQRGRHGPPGRADVPRERLVLPVQLHARRREAGLPRAASRPGRASSTPSSRRR